MMEKSHKHVTCETCKVRKDSLFAQFCNDEVAHLDDHKACLFHKKHQALFIIVLDADLGFQV